MRIHYTIPIFFLETSKNDLYFGFHISNLNVKMFRISIILLLITYFLSESSRYSNSIRYPTQNENINNYTPIHIKKVYGVSFLTISYIEKPAIQKVQKKCIHKICV